VAVAVSGFFVWLFSYSAVRTLVTLDIWGLKLYRHRTSIIIWLVVFALSSFAVYRFRFKCESIGRFLAIVAPILILFPLFSIASHSLNKDSVVHLGSVEISKSSPVHFVQSDSLPDIYYIILDAYMGQNALKRYLGFDNTAFVNTLKQKGFFVAPKSHSNYSWTSLSIASTLNMEYLTTQTNPDHPDRVSVDPSISERDLILRNRVAQILRTLGYEYVDLSIWQTNTYSDPRSYAYQFVTSDFTLALLRMTLLERPLVENYLLGFAKRDRIIRRFDELRSLPLASGPRFIYAHFLVPHHPYVFDENGKVPPFLQMVAELGSEKDLYKSQLLYANKEIQKTIDVILARSKRKPIIVLQGDHGAYRLGKSETENEQMRMSILNAYYLPDASKTLLYDSISPVNTFRLILNSCYGQHYGLLPDKSYFSAMEDIHLLRDVTNSLDR
jgi:hypothetical protein